MSLASNLSKLKSDISSALDNKVKLSLDGEKTPDIISSFAKDASKSIDEFSLTAVVNTTSTIPPGSIDTASAGTNATPVIGQGTGGISGLDVSGLEKDIKKAYEKASSMGVATADKGAPKHTSEEIIDSLSKDMSEAVLKYAKTALVTTEVTYPTFNSAGLPPLVTPAVMLPGEKSDGTGQGGSNLGLTGLDSKASNLKSVIESAYKKATEAGSETEASYEKVNSDLGSDLGQAIYDFFISSVVKTEDTTQGGTDAGPVSGGSTMQNPAPPPPMIPTVPPPKTIPGAVGNAVGTVS